MIIDSAQIPPQMAGSTLKALCLLAETGPMIPTDLALAVGFSPSAATGLLDRLEKEGWARRERRREDRRKVFVVLTRAGLDLIARLQPQPEAAKLAVA